MYPTPDNKTHKLIFIRYVMLISFEMDCLLSNYIHCFRGVIDVKTAIFFSLGGHNVKMLQCTLIKHWGEVVVCPSKFVHVL